MPHYECVNDIFYSMMQMPHSKDANAKFHDRNADANFQTHVMQILAGAILIKKILFTPNPNFDPKISTTQFVFPMDYLIFPS